MWDDFLEARRVEMAKKKSKTAIRREYKEAVDNLKEAGAALYGEACRFDLDVLLGLIASKARKGDYSPKSHTTGIS